MSEKTRATPMERTVGSFIDYCGGCRDLRNYERMGFVGNNGNMSYVQYQCTGCRQIVTKSIDDSTIVNCDWLIGELKRAGGSAAGIIPGNGGIVA